MATNYLVAWDDDPARGIERGTFGCSASGPAEAIGEFERSMHARALLRAPLEVRAYGPEQNPLQAPSHEDALAGGVIEPAPFKARFSEPRLDRDGRASVEVEINGRLSATLREAPPGDKRARWSVSWSQLPPGQLRIAHLEQVGKSKPLSLGEACREAAGQGPVKESGLAVDGPVLTLGAALAAPTAPERCR